MEKLFFYCNLFQKVKLSYILDSLHESIMKTYFKSFFVLILMIRAYSSWKSKIQYLKILEYLHLSFVKWPSLQYSRYLLFFETTIMEKTADLAMIQKTNIDTLHKDSKWQRVITERGGCSKSSVSKHIKCKVDRNKDIG